MRSVLLSPGIFYVLRTSLILSLVHRLSGKIALFDLCTRNHCEDCYGGEVLKCSNGAIFDRCGDLCGCCQSCVRFQDLGESCGSQLAVRSSEKFRLSRVAVLATTRCKKNLICENFICKRSLELRSKLITTSPIELENEHRPLATGSPDIQCYENDVDFMTQGSERPRETSSSTSVKNMTIESCVNKIFGREVDLKVEAEKKTIFDPSGHVINLLVDGGELQLIHGHEASADFNILMGSIEKNLTKSIFEKPETGHAASIAIPLDFVYRALSSKISMSGTSSKKLREKRQLDRKLLRTNVEDQTQENQKEISDKNRYPGISVYDVINKTPREIEDFEHWLSSRAMEGNSNETLDSDETESEINIHITGVPGATNLSFEDVRMDEKNNEGIPIDTQLGEKDDRVNGANNVTISNRQMKNSLNSTSKIFQDQENHDSVDSGSETAVEKLQFPNNNFEFTFPEYPVILENKRNADGVANETAEFRAQLDRIETRAIVIENVVHAIIKKIDTNDGIVERLEKNRLPGEDTMFQGRAVNPTNGNAIDLRARWNEDGAKNVTQENCTGLEFQPKRSRHFSKIRRRRPHRSEENHETEVSRDWSDRRRRTSSAAESKNSMENFRKGLDKRKVPIFLSNRGWKRSNLHDRHREDSRLVQHRSNLKGGLERSAWPFNFYRALPVDRSSRRLAQDIGGRPPETDNRLVEESLIFLDTQMPRSIRLVTKDDDAWNSRATTRSNLFVAEGGNTGIPETSVSELSASNENHQEIADDGESYWPLPLDYAERSEPKDERVVIDDSGDAPANPDRNESINPSLDRSKRAASNMKNKILSPKRHDGSSHSNANLFQNWPTGRSRRSVEMIDWLRAAREYHQRLRQLRAAALKTWLASRDTIADANLTNVKLFTRAIAPETHGSTSFRENFEDIPYDRIEDYPADFRDDATADSSEILTDILVEESSPYEPRANESVDQRFIQVSGSSGPRKLTITTNGNSTIRIEEMRNDGATRVEDQLTQGSIADEVSHEIPITASDNDYFDHMYESFDTEDGDFNYDVSDPSMSGWFNQFDAIESPDEKDPAEDRSSGSSYGKGRSDPRGRYKRNSPLVLFKINGTPKKDILVWPSNWRDLIDRHLKLNRSGNNQIKTTKRRAYLGSRKIVTAPVLSRLETAVKNDEREN